MMTPTFCFSTMVDPPITETPAAGSRSFSFATPINNPTLRRHYFLTSCPYFVSTCPTQVLCRQRIFIFRYRLGIYWRHRQVRKPNRELLNNYIDKKAEASKESVTLSSLDSMVDKQLCMNMSDPSATSRMRALFIALNTVSRKSAYNFREPCLMLGISGTEQLLGAAEEEP